MVRVLIAASWPVALAIALALPAAAQSPASTTPPAPPPAAAAPKTATVHIDGFRSAKWGMNEVEVKAAIASEFRIPADKLKGEANLNERTTVLAITVPNLLEGAGTARVSYIFGYQTKKLIEVNIVWGTPVDPQGNPEVVVAAANQLRDLFLTQGYDPATIVANAKANDGSIIVFSGQDADKHTTLLRLMQTPGNEKAKQPATTTLFLSYVLDSKNPDIFRLKNGQF